MRTQQAEKIKVSILCITYNHAPFIAQCLDSFLSQKTNFEFEIIIHDDASTDNTSKIIHQYAKQYPKKITPIYAKKNEYSKNPHFFIAKLLPYIHGKYVAFCEGDDYWTDTHKLQIQYDYMENHSLCTLLFHNTDILYMNTGKIEYNQDKNIYGNLQTPDNNYTPDNIQSCRFATHASVPSASEFFRTKDIKNLPKCFYTPPCADLPLELILSSKGYAHYIPKSMSMYRKSAGSSVSDSWKKDSEGEIARSKQFIAFIREFNNYTNHKYANGLFLLEQYYNINILISERKPFKIILDNKKRPLYQKAMNDRFFIKLFLRSLAPNLFSKLQSKLA